MPTNRDVKKRRVRMARVVEAQRTAEARRIRRRRYLVGGSAGLLVISMVISLAAGLFVGSTDRTELDIVSTEISTDSLPPTESDTPSDTPPDLQTELNGAVFAYGSGDCPEPNGASGPVLDFEGPPPLCIDPSRHYAAVFDTSEGEIRFDLTTTSTPGTVNNFVTLARWGYYDSTLLFRTDPSIDIIQGGSPHTDSPGDPGPGYTISDEPAFGIDPTTGEPVGPYRYEPGQIVMARSQGIDSAGAQFFFTTGPNAAHLDSQGVYVVFGATDAVGLAVLQSIMDLHIDTGELGGAPSRPVTVHSVTIEES